MMVRETNKATYGAIGDEIRQKRANPQYPRFREEFSRHMSFRGWPKPQIKPGKLAAAGFFYLGEADKVTCFECGLEINEWKIGEDPMIEHRRDSPDCRFINGLPCGNVPSGSENAATESATKRRACSPSTGAISRSVTPSVIGGATILQGILNCPTMNAELINVEETSNKEERNGKSTAAGASEKPLGKGKATTSETRRRNPWKEAKISSRHTVSPPRIGDGYLLAPVEIEVSHDETGLYRTDSDEKIHKYSMCVAPPPPPQAEKLLTSKSNNSKRLIFDFSNYDTRVESFKEWPQGLTQSPESMADAGFYYLGVGDKVKCFSCKGMWFTWMPSNSPWEEHAKDEPNCGYVIERKGKNYIQDISLKYSPDKTIAETMAYYRSFCEKKIQTVDRKRGPLSVIDRNALAGRIPAGFVSPAARLDDVVFENLCRYCGKRRVGGIYVPCTHAVACYQCAEIADQCDICHKDIINVKKMVILPERPYTEYEKEVSPMMMQEARDLTTATIRTLQALGNYQL